MGYYIEMDSKGDPLPIVGKADALIADGGTEIKHPIYQKNLICVVENASFDAARWVDDEGTFDWIMRHPDDRPKRWLVHENCEELIAMS